VGDQTQSPASPRARRAAKEHRVDLATLAPTGKGGRIRERDVLAAATSTSTSGVKQVPLTPMRTRYSVTVACPDGSVLMVPLLVTTPPAVTLHGVRKFIVPLTTSCPVLLMTKSTVAVALVGDVPTVDVVETGTVTVCVVIVAVSPVPG
jgi:hypothetical protein